MVAYKKTGLLFLAYSALIVARNDYQKLLDKRYNEVSFLCTHNAQSNKGPNLKTFTSVQNQKKSIPEQLNAGIRGMKIPVFLQENKILACHGINKHVIRQVREAVDKKIKKHHIPKVLADAVKKTLAPLLPKTFGDIYFHPEKVKPCFIDPAAKELKKILNDVRLFLEQNPTEIVTIFIENWIDHKHDFLQQISNLCKESGIDQYLYALPEAAQEPKTNPWPTLGELIRNNKRLIVFIDKKGAKNPEKHPFNYMHPATWSSAYNFDDAKKLIDDQAKKAPPASWKEEPGKIWILQHFVTKKTGGCATAAEKVNTKKTILNRINRYKEKHELPNPTFIWVDFFNEANANTLFELINELNGVK